MKLSTKGRHAVTAMMELALRHQKGPVTLAEISVQQSISISYLEQLFARLRNARLVQGFRGPGGGYTLQSPAEEITIADILTAVNDAPSAELTTMAGEQQPESAFRWQQLSKRIYGFLGELTLAETITQQTGTSNESTVTDKGFGAGVQRSAA